MLHGKVCLIGAGSSGITVAKTLHERGIPFDCLEKGSGVGGLWRYQNDNGLSAAYRSLHINTSRDKMQFADYPMPRDYPHFPHHSLILKYFEDYVDHFGFRDKITFQTSVLSVQRQPDRSFQVATEDRAGNRRAENYAAVLIASGHHWKPRRPTFPGQFDGHTLHSHDYRTAEGLEGKRVLVIGMGNSGCDIACEASRVAAKVLLSTRRGAHIIPKFMFGVPLDQVLGGWAWRYLPHWLFKWLFEQGLQISRGKLTNYGLPKPKHKILEEHPTISGDLLNLIGHGEVHIRPNVERLEGTRVRFTDDTVEDVDVIVYATGYDIGFPFLGKELFEVRDNEVRLYKYVVHPQFTNLLFIGLVQPWGAIMPLAEAQGKWAADLIEGRCGLPAVEDMERDIDRLRRKMARRYTQTARHTIQVDFYTYLDEMRRQRRRRGQPLDMPTTREAAATRC